MKDTKKVIFHIGMPRAASTFLQKEIFPNIKNFSFYGPPYTNSNNAFLALKCLDPTIYNKKLVQKELNKLKGDKILISSEWFVGYNQWKYINRTLIAHRLAEFYPNATILLVIRNQLSLLRSLYALGIRMGAISMPIDQYFINMDYNFSLQDYKNMFQPREGHREMVLKPKETLAPYIYQNIIDLYRALFPSVQVLLLEDLQKNPQTFLNQIEKIVGERISPTDAQRTSLKNKVNKSLSARQLTLLRYFNKFQALSTSKLGVNKIFSNIKKFMTSKSKESDPLRFPEKTRNKIADFYAPYNKVLNSEYLDKKLSKYSKQYFLNQ